LLTLIGLLYVLVFGGLSWLRREGAPTRLAIEGVALTLLIAGLAALTGAAPNPVLLLALLYLVTMRARLLSDVGNWLARRGDHGAAGRAYDLALRLWPDEASRLVVRLNQGVLALHRGQPDQAIAIFREVLAAAGGGYLGIKYESACHYNLAVAYQKQGLDAQAVLEFNAVLDTWPASEYARYASIALERRKQKKTATKELHHGLSQR
jgi:tetratricopeptide (TPR) repeat protein